MGLFNHFPYPDTHQLNLDWILDAVKTCVDKVTELWTYVREPGAGIQKALTDAQAAAKSAQTNATSAQASAANARTSATSAQAALTDSNAAANTAQTSARNAQTAEMNAKTAAMNAKNSENKAEKYLADVQSMMGKLYPVGAVYVNFRNQALDAESDATVIARLQALTGGTWARAGSHGQPVTESALSGWALVMLGNAAGDANDINFNIYVRTA